MIHPHPTSTFPPCPLPPAPTTCPTSPPPSAPQCSRYPNHCPPKCPPSPLPKMLPLLLLLLPTLTLSLSLPAAHIPAGLLYLPHAGLHVDNWEQSPGTLRPSLADSLPPLSRTSLLRRMGVHVPGDALLLGRPLTRQGRRRRLRGRRARIAGKASVFVVAYADNTPAEAVAAFEVGVRTWADVFPCAVEIRVSFGWEEIGGGTLAAANTPFFVPGSVAGAGALDDATIYSPSMAASLTGTDFVGPGDFHVIMTFNSKANWHFDVRKDAPFDKWDLATTALHEVCHGLFFSGVVTARGENAFFSSGSQRPARFDTFLAASTGSGLASQCKGDGGLFFRAVTNGGLRFTDEAAEGVDFSLYSPEKFQPGSSTYHHDPARLGEDCRKAGIAAQDCSDLMTQKLPNGYTQRVIGTPVLLMLKSMRGTSRGARASEVDCNVPALAPGARREEDGGNGKSVFTESFTMPPWAIACIAGIAAVGIIAVAVALISSYSGR